MKKILFIAAALLIATTSLLAGPTEKLINVFNSTFPQAQNIKWHEDENGYLVSFTQSGKYAKATYDRNGQFLSALKYYRENDLPVNILLAVRKKYVSETIESVTELTTAEGVSWFINLSDEKKWSVVKASGDGAIALQYSYKKQ